MLQKWIRTLRLCSPEKLHHRARLALSSGPNLQKFSHERWSREGIWHERISLHFEKLCKGRYAHQQPSRWLKWTLEKPKWIYWLDTWGLKTQQRERLSQPNHWPAKAFHTIMHAPLYQRWYWSLRMLQVKTINSQIQGILSLPDLLQNSTWTCQGQCIEITFSRRCWRRFLKQGSWPKLRWRKKRNHFPPSPSLLGSHSLKTGKTEQVWFYNRRVLLTCFRVPWIVSASSTRCSWHPDSAGSQKKPDVARTATAVQAFQLCSTITQQQQHLKEISRSKTDVQLPCSSSLILPPPMN